MNFAPLGVFGAIAAVIATKGLRVFVFYGKYLLFFLIGIALLWVVVISVGFIVLGKRLPELLKRIAHRCSSHSVPQAVKLFFQSSQKNWNGLAVRTRSLHLFCRWVIHLILMAV